jgi:hypothetical protein
MKVGPDALYSPGPSARHAATPRTTMLPLALDLGMVNDHLVKCHWHPDNRTK